MATRPRNPAADLLALMRQHPDIEAEFPALYGAIAPESTPREAEEFVTSCIERVDAVADEGAARLLLAAAAMLFALGKPLPPPLCGYLTNVLTSVAHRDQKDAGGALNLKPSRGGSRTTGSLDRELRVAIRARNAYQAEGRWRESRRGTGACELIAEEFQMSAERVDAIRKYWAPAVDRLEALDLLDTAWPFHWIYRLLLAESEDLDRIVDGRLTPMIQNRCTGREK